MALMNAFGISAINPEGAYDIHGVVCPRTFYTDLNDLWLLAEWH
jgi:hypothetical protein